ncbi:hypothetical protein T492DRAFT_90312 [Pavlovales sp. CCMP2436]|nr:hypothetical protein T492DRAFT_90312 [Pavlovales sp. CCMP2436]
MLKADVYSCFSALMAHMGVWYAPSIGVPLRRPSLNLPHAGGISLRAPAASGAFAKGASPPPGGGVVGVGAGGLPLLGGCSAAAAQQTRGSAPPPTADCSRLPASVTSVTAEAVGGVSEVVMMAMRLQNELLPRTDPQLGSALHALGVEPTVYAKTNKKCIYRCVGSSCCLRGKWAFPPFAGCGTEYSPQYLRLPDSLSALPDSLRRSTHTRKGGTQDSQDSTDSQASTDSQDSQDCHWRSSWRWRCCYAHAQSCLLLLRFTTRVQPSLPCSTAAATAVVAAVAAAAVVAAAAAVVLVVVVAAARQMRYWQEHATCRRCSRLCRPLLCHCPAPLHWRNPGGPGHLSRQRGCSGWGGDWQSRDWVRASQRSRVWSGAAPRGREWRSRQPHSPQSTARCTGRSAGRAGRQGSVRRPCASSHTRRPHPTPPARPPRSPSCRRSICPPCCRSPGGQASPSLRYPPLPSRRPLRRPCPPGSTPTPQPLR